MPRFKRNNEYDPFAWLYANYWGDEFHEQAVPALERLVLHLLPRGAQVLDLCCGDGKITQALVNRGFAVTGLDASQEMLTYAQKRNPGVKFYLSDARRFDLPEQFDAAISTFDSLNHVLDVDDLFAVFERVYASLKPGGYFAFDLNRESAYTDLWSRTSTMVDQDAVSIARGSYDSKRGLAKCDITCFRRAGKNAWERNDFRMTQRFHPQATVTQKLANAGFTVETFDAAADLGMAGDIGQERNFYLAQKPSRTH